MEMEQQQEGNDTIICSFDVGIRNLGFAILKKPTDTDIISVMHLGVVDFLDTRKKTCSGTMKSGKRRGEMCGKSASVQVAKRKTDDWEFYCKTHLPKEISKKTYKTKQVRKQNVKNTSIQDMSMAIIQALKNRNFEDQATTVLIENQPGRASQRTKTVQFIIYAYFMLQGIMNSYSSIKDVQLVSASRKLQIYTGPKLQWKPKIDYDKLPLEEQEGFLPEPDISNRKRKEYRKRKILGEAHTQRILSENGNCAVPVDCPGELYEYYLGLTKKDDASDALLQGLSYFVKESRKKPEKR